MNDKAEYIINKLSEMKDDETAVECFGEALKEFHRDTCRDCIDEVLKAVKIAVKNVRENNSAKLARRLFNIISIANKYMDEDTIQNLFDTVKEILDRFQKWHLCGTSDMNFRADFDRLRMSIQGVKNIDEAFRLFHCSCLSMNYVFKNAKAKESYNNLVSEQTELEWRKQFLDYQLSPETERFKYCLVYEQLKYFKDMEYMEKFYLKMADYRKRIDKKFWDDAIDYMSRILPNVFESGNFELLNKCISLVEKMSDDIDKNARSYYYCSIGIISYTPKPCEWEYALEKVRDCRSKLYYMNLPKKRKNFNNYDLVENEEDAKLFYYNKEHYQADCFDPREFDPEAHEKMIESYEKHSSPELEEKWEREFYEDNLAKIKPGEPYNLTYLSKSMGAKRTPKDERFLNAVHITADGIKNIHDTKRLMSIILPSIFTNNTLYGNDKKLFIKCLEFAENLIDTDFCGINQEQSCTDLVERRQDCINFVRKKHFEIIGVKSYEEAETFYCVSDRHPHFFTEEAGRSYMNFADELKWTQNIFDKTIISDKHISCITVRDLFHLFREGLCTPDNTEKLYNWIENEVPLCEYDRTAESIFKIIIPELSDKSVKKKFLDLAETILNKYIEGHPSNGYTNYIYNEIKKRRQEL